MKWQTDIQQDRVKWYTPYPKIFLPPYDINYLVAEVNGVVPARGVHRLPPEGRLAPQLRRGGVVQHAGRVDDDVGEDLRPGLGDRPPPGLRLQPLQLPDPGVEGDVRQDTQLVRGVSKVRL